MPTETRKSASQPDDKTAPKEANAFQQLVLSTCFLVISGIAMVELYQAGTGRSPLDPYWDGMNPAPLVMKGGDPYIRALMRTISASESNDPQPYSILYGGSHASDLSNHPDTCIPIVAGPNIGDCTTAAGRYQFLTDTWLEKASLYHPQRSRFRFWGDSYSFAPEYQDEVVYHWLSDSSAWGVDISQLLQAGQLADVLWMLSPTWTSLGYGIETNSMSAALPQIYNQMLQEELNEAANAIPEF